jgi:hypothetical protein
MTETNKKIVESAYKAMFGQLAVENSAGGWCLRVTRQIIQDALKIDHAEFYKRYMQHKASGTDPNVPFARDVQLSLRNLGYGVSESDILPGDLFFSWKPMPWGHVGIVLNSEYAIENLSGNRPIARNKFLCVSRIEDIKKTMPLEFFRLP